MSGGLVLKLAPNERVLINGAVIENGDRRTRLSIRTPHTHILRLADALHPDEATTPVSRAVLKVQLLLSGDLDPAQGRPACLAAIEQLSQVFTDADSRRLLDDATAALLGGSDYHALKALRRLLPREARVLALVGR